MVQRVRQLVVFTLVIIALFAAAATQAKTTLQAAIGYGDMDEVTQVLQTIFAEFQKEHPNTELDVQYIGGGHLVGQIPVLTASGLPPDIIFLWSFDYANLARQGYFLPLDPYIQRDMEDVLFPGMYEAGMANGELVGLPLYGGPAGINYNIYHFEAAGIPVISEQDTWDDFAGKAKKLTKDTDGDGTIDRWGFVWYSFVLRDWITWVWRNGGDLFNDDRTEFLLHEQAAAQALQWLADLTNMEGVTPPHTVLYINPWEYFGNQTASIYPQGAWGIGGLNNPAFPMDIAGFPRRHNERVATEAFFVAAHRHTKHPELAARFVQFLAESEFAQGQLYTLGYGIPFNKDAAMTYFLGDDIHWNREAFIGPLQLGTSELLPFPANWDQVQAILRQRYHADVWSGAKAAQIVGLELKDTIDALIQDY